MIQQYFDLFDPKTRKHFEDRIATLTPDKQAQWGKMNIAQMLAHCVVGLEQTMSREKPAPRNLFSKLMGPLFRGMLTNDKPYAKGTPTSPEFVMLGSERDFGIEKARLLKAIQTFSEGGPEIITPYEHPFFGKLTTLQWNRAQCKHLNHHLTQFGA
jgi:hypothetical protein